MTTKYHRAPWLAAFALVSVTMLWGSTFPLIKVVQQQMSTPDFLAVRFVLATVVLTPWLWRHRTRRVVIPGLSLGVVYGLSQLVQTYGLELTPASVSGFVTGLYVVMTPVVAWLIYAERPRIGVIFACILATFGLGVLALRGLSLGLGETITAISALGYAVHIVALARFAPGRDAIGLTAWQLAGTAVVCLVAAGATGTPTLPPDAATWGAVVFMALGAGTLAMFAQTWAQARLGAATAAVIMTGEPVFAALFAVGFGGETVTWRLAVGGACIAAAMVIAEVRFNNTSGDAGVAVNRKSSVPR